MQHTIDDLVTASPHFLGMDAPYGEAKVVVFGAPFDGTTSNRPGTRFSTTYMRVESEGLETYSPLLRLDLEDTAIRDQGDIVLNNGNTPLIMEQIKTAVAQVLADGKIPFMVGGEHLVTLPAVQAIHEKYPNVYILHLDAHTDLADMLNGEKLSHGTVIRRVWELLGDGRIYQFGIRSGTRSEFDFALVDKHTTMEPLAITTTGDVIKQLAGKQVYVTIDLDVLDPSIFPGTGTPEPGGITYRELEQFFLQLQASELDIVGADIVELSPHYDHSSVSTVVGCKVLRDLGLILANQ